MDEFFPYLTRDEQAILVYAVRRIFGWQRRAARIPVSEAAHDVAMSRTCVIRCMTSLIKANILIDLGFDGDYHAGRNFGLQLDSSAVEWTYLKDRRARSEAVNRVKAGKARDGKDRSMPQTDPISPCHRPESVHAIDILKDNLNPTPHKRENRPLDGDAVREKIVLPVIHVTHPLEPSTAGARTLFRLLQADARASGHKGPQRFRTHAQKQAFERAETSIGDRMEALVMSGMEAGISDLGRMVAYLTKRKNGPVAPAARKPANLTPRVQAVRKIMEEEE